jgi:predicted cupin superfamily sugar epimerase
VKASPPSWGISHTIEAAAGQALQQVAPHGCWFGVEIAPGGSFLLASCSLAPGWDEQDTFLPTGDDLRRLKRQHPDQACLLDRLATQSD